MAVNDERFWSWLRDEVADADACGHDRATQQELAEAEALLRELDDDEPAQLQPDRIDELVAFATGEPVREQAPARVHHISPARRMLGAAAALLVAPKFLVAATAVTAIAAAVLVLQNTTRSLPFQDAVAILMNDTHDEATRQAAQGRVYLDVVESLSLVRRLTEQDATAGQAFDSLARVRDALDAQTPFALTAFAEPLADLRRRAGEPQLAAAAQRDALAALTEQAVYGISALVAVSRAAGPTDLLRHNAAQLQNLRALAR